MLNTISPNTLFVGQQIHYLPTCHSTNDVAYNLLSQSNISEGTVIITPKQTAGKGQRGNKWEAEPGKNLTFSIILKPNYIQIKDQFFLNVITSLAVHETLTHFLQKKINIKWPNDIYCKEKKICGILIQNVLKKQNISASIVGIGLNVNQKRFSENRASSMALIHECDFNLEQVLEYLLESFEKFLLLLKSSDLSALKDNYLSKLFGINEERTFQGEEKFEGIIRGVDHAGRLAILVNNKLKFFSMKEVKYL